MKKDKSFTNSTYHFNPYIKFPKCYPKDHSVVTSSAIKSRDITPKRFSNYKKQQTKKEESSFSEEISTVSDVKICDDSSCSSILDNIQQHKHNPKTYSDEELANIIFQSGGTIDDVYYIKKWIEAGLITP
jgi:hypothetical protein